MSNKQIASWHEHYDQASQKLIFAKLNKVIAFNAKGEISPANIKFDSYISVLNGMIVLSEHISDRIKEDIIFNTAISLFKKGKLNHQFFIEAVDYCFKSYLRKGLKEYYFVTSISFDKKSPIKSTVINGCDLRFIKELPKKLLSQRKIILDYALSSIKYPDNYLYVKAKTCGRSIHEAAESALRSINLFRCIWNFNYNRRITFCSTDFYRPFNSLLLGPIHTLHNTDCTLATDKYWYEPDYSRPRRAITVGNDINKFYDFKIKILKKVRDSNFKDTIEDLIIQYSDAFDLQDPDGTFLKLWCALENLIISKREQQKDIINRISFLENDSQFAKLILTHLRLHRNLYAHSGSSRCDSTMAIFQLKAFIEKVILFIIENKFKLGSKSELRKFLDHPVDRCALRNRFELAKKAMRYRSRPQ